MTGTCQDAFDAGVQSQRSSGSRTPAWRPTEKCGTCVTARYTLTHMALTDTEDRAKCAAAGRGVWRELANGHDLVAELIAERPQRQRTNRTPTSCQVVAD